MTKCNPAPTPGTSANKSTFADTEPLTPDQHQVYRRVVGKLQWLPFTRPDISYSTKELAASKRTTPTNRSRLEESKASTQIPTWNKQLHTTTTTNNNTQYKQSSPRYGCTCGCQLGRMPGYTPEHNRVCHLHPRNTSKFWFPNTGYNSIELCRK